MDVVLSRHVPMLRLLVSLLAAASLLMPPGMCLCGTNARVCAACCGHEHSGAGHRHQDAKSPAGRTVKLAFRGGTPVHGQHAPGCPALRAADDLKMPEPPHTPAAASAPAPSWLAVLCAANPSAPVAPFPAAASATPLYLAHRTLRI